MVFSFRCGKVVFHWRWMTFSLFKLSDPFLVLRFTQFGTSNKASGINLGQVTLLHFIDECVCYNSLHQWQFYGSRLDSRLIFWEIKSLSWCKIVFDVLTVLETVAGFRADATLLSQEGSVFVLLSCCFSVLVGNSLLSSFLIGVYFCCYLNSNVLDRRMDRSGVPGCFSGRSWLWGVNP